jgi:hypothetical protein
MSGNPYIPLYIGDWLKDPKLSLCSPATRGVWIDLICCLHELGQGGKITANAQQLARLCRSSDADVHAALKELQATEAADIYERDGVYTVICRRMRKADALSLKRRQAGSKGAAKRQQNPDIEIDNESGLERVRGFAKGEGIPQSDADWFYWKGKGNGWTNGGKPILDWKATLRSWQKGRYLPSQRRQSSNDFVRPKERAPSYPEPPPKREPTPEELANAKAIAAGEVAKLKAQLRK